MSGFHGNHLRLYLVHAPGCHSPYWNADRVYNVKTVARKVNKPAELPKHKPEVKRKVRA
jgi:hypothetical protein